MTKNAKQETEKEYTISMKVDGRIDITVKATDPEEAKRKAERVWETEDIDFNKMEIVDSFPVNCFNETEGLHDYV